MDFGREWTLEGINDEDAEPTMASIKAALNTRSLTQREQWWLVAEAERLRDALTEAPMVALGRTNTAFARWCMEQAQPTGQEVR